MQRNADLRAVLDRFSRARIAVVGDLVADEYIYGETDRVSREAPVLIVRYESSDLKLGCAANAVANLCALGARVSPVGLVGEDLIGERLRELLREAGAGVDGVLTASGLPTATKTRVLAGGKNTRRQQMLRIDRDGPRAPPASLFLGRLLGALKAAAREADAIMVSDYGLGLLSAPVIEAVLGLARSGKIVCVDSRFGLSQYRGVTMAKPNEVELAQLSGRALGELSALEADGRDLLRTLHAGALLVTRGRSGMVLLRPGVPTAVLPVHGSAEAVDVTGAGDTVMAASTLALACGADPLQAARLANVAGALVVQKPGTATVAGAELRKELLRAQVAEAELVETAQESPRRRRERR